MTPHSLTLALSFDHIPVKDLAYWMYKKAHLTEINRNINIMILQVLN